MVLARLAALSTTTTLFDPHQGSPLPIARVVVVAVPSAALLIYIWLSRQRRRPRAR